MLQLRMNDEYRLVLGWLETLSSESAFFRKKEQPSLKEVNRALDLMGRPDKAFKYRVIVGGTAGKGSVCRAIEQTLVQEGITCLMLSSPELQIINERIRLNGQLVSTSDFTESLKTIKTLIETNELILTYYEVVVLAGIYLGNKEGGEILICEVGLGGEFDAVNAVQGPRLCGLTFIGDDHLEILGPERKNIAETKSKIFTQESIFNCTYEQKFSSILKKNSNIEILFIKGIRGKLNKKLARNLLEQIIDTKSFSMAITKLPCRWETMPTDQPINRSTEQPKIILDGAHSLARFEYLIQTKLRKYSGPYTLVLGMQKRHDLRSLASILPYGTNIIWTESGKADCHSAEDLQKAHGVGEVVKNPLEALKKAQLQQLPILVTGSLYLCGQIREAYYPSNLMQEQQTEWPQQDLE